MRRVVFLSVLLATLTAGLAPVGAQGPGVAAARVAADKALRSGRFEDVEKLAQPFPADETLVVLRARAISARGDYARAEALLQPLATTNPTGDAALESGLLQQIVGRRTDARRTLQLILVADPANPTPRDYLRAGRAARALGRFEDANAFFRDANAAAPDDVVINTAWGELFAEKYNNKDAARSFQDALKVDAEYGPALLGMARVLADENPPQALGLAEHALKLNPMDVGAHLFLAEGAMDQDKKKEARAAIDRALAVNPRSLDALSMIAALAYVDGRTQEYQDTVATALKINAGYGEIYREVGAITARAYRFEEAAEQARKAIQLDRENIRAYADLGSHLMRTGDERNARRALETAFKTDPYDVGTYNLLSVLDTLDPFDTVREGDMVLRLAPAESAVMRQYAPQLAREAMAALSKRWEFTPTGPILVEMFPKHDDFAVRTVGLPGMLGALGACFGKVVTLDSPHARPPGEFNWGVTLWHELAHVITLQLSNQRIPRWLTEGISVFEEKRARPEWGREMDIPFAQAINSGKVMTLRNLNSGFSNPQLISLAYFEASLVVEHIVEVYGQPKLKALVQSYATGIDTETAIKQVLGVDLDALQKTFEAFVERHYGTLRKAMAVPEGLKPDLPADQLKAMASANPGSFIAQMALGDALHEEAPDAALAAYERAAALVPNATGEDSPQARMAEVFLARGDKVRAARALETLTINDHQDIASGRKLLALLDVTKEPARVQAALRRVVAIDPFDAASHTTLGRLSLAAKSSDEAIRMFRVALAAGPVDRAGAHADLAESLVQAGQREEAKKEALAALELAPTYTRAQDLLLKLTSGGH
ncbi:MAG: tetratricopeptide repeat protein [Vicinamibacterales bacterium]